MKFGFCKKCSKSNQTESENNLIIASFSQLCIECQMQEKSLEQFYDKTALSHQEIAKKLHPANYKKG